MSPTATGGRAPLVPSLPHLEGQRGPRRFIGHAIAADGHHMDEFDVPLAWPADHESRDALGIAPRANFRNPDGITFSSSDDELLGDRLTIHETPEPERIPHNHEIGIRQRHDLGRITEYGFECPRPQIADLEDGFDVLLVALARRPTQLTCAGARLEHVGNPIFL